MDLLFLDGFARRPDAGDAQKIKDGKAAESESGKSAACVAKGEFDNMRFGRESQYAAKGNEAI